jgi:hypothetical protein
VKRSPDIFNMAKSTQSGITILGDDPSILPTSDCSNGMKGKQYDVMIARLQLANHRAHWIELTRNRSTNKAEFHKYLSDPMTSQSAEKTILMQRFAH